MVIRDICMGLLAMKRMIKSLAIALWVGLILIIGPGLALAENPSHLFFNHSLLQNRDFSGQKLPAAEFANSNLEYANFDEAELRGSVFSRAIMLGVTMRKADLTYAMVDQVDFSQADLSDSIFTEALFLGSTFADTKITGADFTDAIFDREQLRQLCLRAEGVNSRTGVDTRYSLGCR